jgi:hypothetical protein
MLSRYKKTIKFLTLLISLAVGQLYLGVGVSLASASTTVAPQSQIFGNLSTRDNKPITVNGATAVSGATILSGSMIDTPDKVSATIKFNDKATVCIAPNTKLMLEIDASGNLKINIIQGCAILRTQKNTGGTMTSAAGLIGQIDAATGGSIDVCVNPNGVATVNQGAASDAGAGASLIDCGAAAAVAVPTFPLAITAGIIGGVAAGIIVAFTGDNPSASAP